MPNVAPLAAFHFLFQRTVVLIPCQWDQNAIWDSRNVWLPVEIDEDKRDLKLIWHDVYDLNT